MPLKSLELNLYNMAQTIYKIDATDKAPGRIATEIVNVLQGKNKPSWAPNVDNNAVVEINNAAKMRVTGKKMEDKIYYDHSGYPGGLRARLMKELSPEEIIKRAVSKMLPKNRFRDKRLKRIIVK